MDFSRKKVEFAFFAWRGGGWGAGGNPTVKKPKHFSLSANMCQPGLFQRRKIDNPLQALVFATIHLIEQREKVTAGNLEEM